MPNFMSVFGYKIYFWSNEGKPLEPVHVHIDKVPQGNGTKVWILSTGRVLLDNNNSNIKHSDLKKLLQTIELFADEIVEKWEEYYKESATYYDERDMDIEDEWDLER